MRDTEATDQSLTPIPRRDWLLLAMGIATWSGAFMVFGAVSALSVHQIVAHA